MRILSADRHDSEVVFETDMGRLRLMPWGEDRVRVTLTREKEFSTEPGPFVLPRPEGPPPGELAESETRYVFRLPRLTVVVDKATAALSYFGADGTLLTQEPARGGKTLDAFEVIRYDFEAVAGPAFEFGADGFKSRAAAGKPRVDRKAWHTKLEFEFQAGEALYGLGSHEEGVMNLRGTVQYLYQQNMKIAIPYLVSTRRWAVLWNTGSAQTFRDDSFGSSVWTECAQELDFWFVTAQSLPKLALAFRQLTGSVPLLPRWAFGYVQSKERYKTQAEILETAREFRRRGLPLDCIVLDWQSWPEGLWGQKTFDPERFPDPAAMVRELHTLGVKFMVSIWPNLREGGENHRQFVERGLLLGNQSTYDAFNPEARDLYWEQAKQGLFDQGVDAWWCDCTEPFEADWNGAVKPEPEDRRAINLGEFRKYLDPSRVNEYSLHHSEGLYTHQRAASSEKRVVNLTRSAFPGQQRYSTIAWSGDFAATWEQFRRQIPAAANYCATGMPWWTFDIGAFFVTTKPELWFWNGDYSGGVDDPAYRELYLRMFQFGAFLPMFRSHGTDTPREPWRFGAPGDPVYDSLVTFLRLRLRLMPWIYSQAADLCLGESTLVRPVAFDFPEDVLTHDLNDQYLFGEGLLVCPVVEPGGSGQTRPVYLPAGADWYDFWTTEFHRGGQTLVCAAGWDRLPLFVRAGTLLVLQQPWEVRIYAGADAKFSLYEDAGDGYAYEQGQWSRTRIAWADGPGRLTIDSPSGHFPGMEVQREFLQTVIPSRS